MNTFQFLARAAGAGLLLGLTAPTPARAQAAAPAAEWNFEEGAGTAAADSAGSGGAAALQGGAGWAAGLIGAHALSLPGTPGSFADVSKPVIDTARSFTATAWVKVKAAGTDYQTVVSEDGDQVSAFFLQLRGDTGGFAFTVFHGDAVTDASIAGAKDPAKAGVWYFLAGVHDAAAHTVTLYVNGVAQQTVPQPTPWHATGHTLIGRGKFSGNPVDFVNGQVDDVRLYQSALSAADVAALNAAAPAQAQAAAAPAGPATLWINTATPSVRVSPLFYGLMTEEINHAYDGGLYAELIQNRTFQDPPAQDNVAAPAPAAPAAPTHWSLVQDGGGSGSMALDTARPLSAALPISLKLTMAPGGGGRVGAANDGYWGVPVPPNARYQASLYARASGGFAGPLTVDVESSDGRTVYAQGKIPKITGDWAKYTVSLTAGKAAPTLATRFVVSAGSPGTVSLSLVSLFPPTYHNRVNGNRVDLMQKLAGLSPGFLRMPGGNYLEGNTVAERFDWKKTIGPLAGRPGHQGPWGYRSSDGLGLLEYLGWCEDLHMHPLLAVFAGYALGREYVPAGPRLTPFVQDALDEIEYVTGDATTKWGAERAKDGHPAPFPLEYVEVGNEDFFDRSGSYEGRFGQFFDAIKAKYPKLQVIATTAVKGRTPDLVDDHFYRTAQQMEGDVHHYDSYPRTGGKVFVGEWASQETARPWTAAGIAAVPPTPNLDCALGDAAWMTGLERNADVVALECYAPLFVNVNPGGRQWATNLIGYDALTSFNSPSYYAQAMFDRLHGDTVLPAVLSGGAQLFQSVTRDSKTGTVYLHVVNAAGAAQAVHVSVKYAARVAPTGTSVVLSGADPADTNSLADPVKIVPAVASVVGLGAEFDYTFPAYSVTVLQLQTK